jgi:tetraprenyl-beta-curcumene synthase
MPTGKLSGVASAADLIVALSALLTYQRRIVPRVRAELAGWQARAIQIPDRSLRATALAALAEKSSNVAATAVFAILAPHRERAAVLRAIVALQAAIDYLDSLGEVRATEPLADGLALQGALCDAVSPGAPARDWYRHHPQREDGGYLAALVGACQEAVAALPGREAVAPALGQAAARCGEGQSHVHAAAWAGSAELEEWAARQEAAPGYLWWELAAGASSSVAAHALIAAGADQRTSAAEAERIDAAYFPSIGALTVLLDDLVDREEDLAGGEHNYLSYCENADEAATRIALLASRARAAIAELRQARKHRAILAGVAGFYLSAPATESGYARPIRERLLEATDPTVRPIMVAMRLRGDG